MKANSASILTRAASTVSISRPDHTGLEYGRLDKADHI